MSDSPEKKNVYFVQAGNLYGANVHLPYAAGCIASYAWNNPAIWGNYQLGHFTFLRAPLDRAVAAFENPFLVAFSNYVWNIEYHKALAMAVKKRWPACLIVFGGHQVFNDSSRQLSEYHFVDFLIHKAGEIPFEALLLALLQSTDLSEVPSLSYRGADGNPLRTADAPCSSCDFPSPYLAGIFDALFEEYPAFQFSMTFETNRGCPYGCAFCDWGAVGHAFLLMPMERVKAEIDWAARHRIELFLCADGNFGILERDEAIVNMLIDSKLRTGYPKKIKFGFAKNSDETVLRLNKKLSAHGLNAGATLSCQSLSPVVLKNIGRQNIAYEHFRELVSLYNQAGVPVYTELIIGLPGETLDSFARGIGALLAAGMHGAVEVFPCEVLPNAELSKPAYREEHGIECIRVRQVQRHGSPENRDEINEYSEFVCKTNAMPTEDWVTAFLFATVVQGFNGMGLLPFVAIYLYFEQGLPYERFYFDLMDYAKANPCTLVGEWLSFYRARYRELAGGTGESLVHSVPECGEVTWPLAEALFLRVALASERFFSELPAFLRRYQIDKQVEEELLRYQRAMVQLPIPPPPSQAFEYDFPGYFSAAFTGRHTALQRTRTTLFFPEQGQVSGWEEYARDYVWYGRRKGLLTRKGFEVVYE